MHIIKYGRTCVIAGINKQNCLNCNELYQEFKYVYRGEYHIVENPGVKKLGELGKLMDNHQSFFVP